MSNTSAGVRKFADAAGGATGIGFCQASDAAGITAYCFTRNGERPEAIQNVADYSFVTFNRDGEGQCRMIGISTQSFYIP